MSMGKRRYPKPYRTKEEIIEEYMEKFTRVREFIEDGITMLKNAEALLDNILRTVWYERLLPLSLKNMISGHVKPLLMYIDASVRNAQEVATKVEGIKQYIKAL